MPLNACTDAEQHSNNQSISTQRGDAGLLHPSTSVCYCMAAPFCAMKLLMSRTEELMYKQRQAVAVVKVVIHVTIACVTARMTEATLPADMSLHPIQDAAITAWSTMADQLACAASSSLVLCSL